jgi:hypothetical protein
VPGNASNIVFHAVFQPAGNYWPLQLSELGMFASLAAVMIGFAVWWTHRRA